MAKTAQESARKWVERAGQASGDYSAGVLSTTKDQAALAAAAEDNYKAGVIAAANAGRFGVGVRKAGTQKWRDGVAKKGANRFAEGVSASSDAYATESARFDGARGAAASLPRGPKGSAGNLARVSAVANALRAVKVGSGK